MISVPPRLVRQVERIAHREGASFSGLTVDALHELVVAYKTSAPPSTFRARSLASRQTDGDAIFYRGPSLLTGDTILGIFTGLTVRSLNPKTGPVVQTWILRSDVAPMTAVRRNSDDAICGDCALRGDEGHNRRCYVVPWLGPNNVYRVASAGGYPEVSWREIRTRLEGRSLRLGAYGDPAAIPFEVWQTLLSTSSGWVGYTHQWKRCDPRFRSIVMASVDSLAELEDAQAQGWRTFRVLDRGDILLARRECRCPASDEAGHRTTCERCQLCRGTNRPARSIAIRAHGNNGVMVAFHRNRRSAEASA